MLADRSKFEYVYWITREKMMVQRFRIAACPPEAQREETK